MRRLYTAGHLPEAYLLLHMLESEGIAAQVFNENAQGGVGELPFTHTYPELWVEDRDLDRARSVVERFERPQETLNSFTCTVCGEHNPGTFELCWNCGAPRA